MLNQCINCFAPMKRGGVCPNCGFNNAAYKPRPHHLPPGTVLRERYIVGRTLGEGGFGITYAGYDPVLTRRVAIKEYYPSGVVWREPERSLNVNCLTSGNFTEIFNIGRQKCMQEGRSLANLDDIPAIVRIIDYFPENNTAYLIMEFVEGVTLREYARRQPKRMTLTEILTLLSPVAEALDDVHSRGFVHRDVSPDNVMITEKGKAKLLDFGAVKHMSCSDGTMTQNPIVKRGFSPLELYSTAGKIGPWTDVYAFAATVYYLLVGQPLDEPADRLNDDNAEEKLRAVLPPAQTDAMLHALTIQHKNRQQSVGGFVDELTAAGTQPTPIRTPEKAAEKTERIFEEPPRGNTAPLRAAANVAPGGGKETKLIFDDVNPEEPRAKVEPSTPAPQPVRQVDANRTEYDGYGGGRNDHAVIAAKEEKGKTKSPSPRNAKKRKKLLLGGVAGLLVVALIVCCVVFWPTAPKSVEAYKTLTFGSYEQDNNTTNGKEPIEWLVLKEEGNKALVVSKYALDCQPYNTESTSVTWETCTLRKWLNNEFCNAAFSSSEQADIFTTEVANKDNETYNIDGGNNTRDKVFLLSIDEVNRCFGSDETRKCAPTDYAIAQGAGASEESYTGGRGACSWLLRSPGGNSPLAARVESDGSVDAYGSFVNDSYFGVRPAMWVDMNGLRESDSGIDKQTQFENALAYQKSVNGLISASVRHTAGLKADGTVVATKITNSGYDAGQRDVSGWTDIVAVSAGCWHTVGLKADGTVIATKITGGVDQECEYGQCDVSGWKDIVAVAAGGCHTVGLKADGTVVATGLNDNGQCNVSGWRDIAAVAAGYDHTVGLKADGTVVATEFIESEYNKYSGQCDVDGWTDIVAVAAGNSHTVGLKADGTVVATKITDSGYDYGQCNVGGWRDIVAVAAGHYHTVGLKADGTVVATGENDYGQCDVDGWNNMMLPKSRT